MSKVDDGFELGFERGNGGGVCGRGGRGGEFIATPAGAGASAETEGGRDDEEGKGEAS